MPTSSHFIGISSTQVFGTQVRLYLLFPSTTTCFTSNVKTYHVQRQLKRGYRGSVEEEGTDLSVRSSWFALLDNPASSLEHRRAKPFRDKSHSGQELENCSLVLPTTRPTCVEGAFASQQVNQHDFRGVLASGEKSQLIEPERARELRKIPWTL